MANHAERKRPAEHRYEHGGPATASQDRAEKKDDRMVHRQAGSQDADTRQQANRQNARPG